MTDDRLRDLEKRWSAGISPESAVPHLVERVRAGVLSVDRLNLAAFVGHPAALTSGLAVTCPPTHLEEWLDGMQTTWGSLPLVGASVASALHALASIDPDGHTQPLAWSAAQAAERAFFEPTEENCAAAWQTYRGSSRDHWVDGHANQQTREWFARASALASARAAARRVDAARLGVLHAVRVTDEAAVRAAISSFVASWVLSDRFTGFEFPRA